MVFAHTLDNHRVSKSVFSVSSYTSVKILSNRAEKLTRFKVKSDIFNIWTASHKRGYPHGTSNKRVSCRTFWMTYHPFSIWMVSRQYRFSLVWILSCALRWVFGVNFLLHLEQLNGFSPVWILSWLIREPENLNALSHFKQLNCFLFTWILSCFLRSDFALNAFSHSKQLNGFSPVWVLSCFCKSPDSLNYLSHFKQQNGFFGSVGSLMSLQVTWLFEFFVTLWAAEWFLISMYSFMSL